MGCGGGGGGAKARAARAAPPEEGAAGGGRRAPARGLGSAVEGQRRPPGGSRQTLPPAGIAGPGGPRARPRPLPDRGRGSVEVEGKSSAPAGPAANLRPVTALRSSSSGPRPGRQQISCREGPLLPARFPQAPRDLRRQPAPGPSSGFPRAPAPKRRGSWPSFRSPGPRAGRAPREAGSPGAREPAAAASLCAPDKATKARRP